MPLTFITFGLNTVAWDDVHGRALWLPVVAGSGLNTFITYFLKGFPVED